MEESQPVQGLRMGLQAAAKCVMYGAACSRGSLWGIHSTSPPPCCLCGIHSTPQGSDGPWKVCTGDPLTVVQAVC